MTLISPDGTESVLAERRNDPGRNYRNWTFTSMRHWGESSKGDWLVRVTDRTQPTFKGKLNSLRLQVFGTKTTPPRSMTESFIGTAQADNLRGTRNDDWLDGQDGNDSLWGGLGNDSLVGGPGRDLLRSGGGSDTLVGNAGNDRLIGHRKNDQLLGGDGQDLLIASYGDDHLTGGAGRDTLIGGGGRDRFIYQTPADGGDRIKGFQTNWDVIDVHDVLASIKDDFSGSSELFEAVLDIRQVGAHTVVSLREDYFADEALSSPMVTLENVTARSLTMGNFIV